MSDDRHRNERDGVFGPDHAGDGWFDAVDADRDLFGDPRKDPRVTPADDRAAMGDIAPAEPSMPSTDEP